METSKIRPILELTDGWNILPKADAEKLGVPKKLIKRLYKRHQSRPTIGGTIIFDGREVDHFNGVHGLDLLEAIADMIGADRRGVIAYGRGARAEQLKAAILVRLDEMELEAELSAGVTRAHAYSEGGAA